MIAPNFKSEWFSDADMQAVLKRSHVVMFTDKWVYVRTATQERVEVARFQWPDQADKDLLSPHYRPDYGKYRRGATDMPVNFIEDTVWSHEFMKKLHLGECGCSETVHIQWAHTFPR
jgi:hypothetical protein